MLFILKGNSLGDLGDLTVQFSCILLLKLRDDTDHSQ